MIRCTFTQRQKVQRTPTTCVYWTRHRKDMHGVTFTTYTAETLRKIVPSTFKPQQNTVICYWLRQWNFRYGVCVFRKTLWEKSRVFHFWRNVCCVWFSHATVYPDLISSPRPSYSVSLYFSTITNHNKPFVLIGINDVTISNKWG